MNNTDRLKKIKEFSFWALQKAESKAYSEDAWDTLDAYADAVDDELWGTNKELINQVDDFAIEFLNGYGIKHSDEPYWKVRNILTILAKDDEFLVTDILLER